VHKLSSFHKGIYAESRAESYLRKHGFNILYNRYKTPYGEIDLIALKIDLLLFVEVKNRKNIPNYDFILTKQKKRCCDAAQMFLASHTEYSSFSMRFDCIYIDKNSIITHIENAWDNFEQ
jgi:putative endonuclease